MANSIAASATTEWRASERNPNSPSQREIHMFNYQNITGSAIRQASAEMTLDGSIQKVQVYEFADRSIMIGPQGSRREPRARASFKDNEYHDAQHILTEHPDEPQTGPDQQAPSLLTTLHEAFNILGRIEDDFLDKARQVREQREHLTTVMEFLEISPPTEGTGPGKIGPELQGYFESARQDQPLSRLAAPHASQEGRMEVHKPDSVYERALRSNTSTPCERDQEASQDEPGTEEITADTQDKPTDKPTADTQNEDRRQLNRLISYMGWPTVMENLGVDQETLTGLQDGSVDWTPPTREHLHRTRKAMDLFEKDPEVQQVRRGINPARLARIRPDFQGAFTMRDNLERIGWAARGIPLVPSEVAALLTKLGLSKSNQKDLQYRVGKIMRDNPGLYQNNGNGAFHYNTTGRRAI